MHIVVVALDRLSIVHLVVNTTLNFIVVPSCVVIFVHHVSPSLAVRALVELAVGWSCGADFICDKIHVFLSVNVHSLRGADKGVSFLSYVISWSGSLVNGSEARMELAIPDTQDTFFHRAGWCDMVVWGRVLSQKAVVVACGFFLDTA